MGVTVFAAAFGMAASLGGNTSGSLGADDAVVASCDTDGVTTAYAQVYNTTGSPGYKVDTVTVGGIAAACNGESISAVLTGAAGASLETVTGTVSGTSVTLDFAATTLVESVAGIHIVISD